MRATVGEDQPCASSVTHGSRGRNSLSVSKVAEVAAVAGGSWEPSDCEGLGSRSYLICNICLLGRNVSNRKSNNTFKKALFEAVH